MLQIFQDLKTGKTELKDVPPPKLLPGRLLVRTGASLISAGTERMLLAFGQLSLAGKARSRPDLVKRVLEKARQEGWLNTLQQVRGKLDQPVPLGYSAAGIVEAVGEGVDCLKPGDRVAMAGAGFANHAEINVVPRNLVALVPDGVPLESAAYATVASIALHGVRTAGPQLGEYVVVFGLGLLGLLTVQLLRASGCRVVGIDPDEAKLGLAQELGLAQAATAKPSSAARAVEIVTGGRGADHVIITASTKGNQPVELAGRVARRKAIITVVGAVGMEVPRDLYYKKELQLRLSTSYGPGRYDLAYEEGGVDYPYEYVRWTEQRNLESTLALLAEGRLQVGPLTTHRFAISDALGAYDLIGSNSEPHVGIVLSYDLTRPQPRTINLASGVGSVQPGPGKLGLSFIGAGSYATSHLLPHIVSHSRAETRGLMSASGLTARQKAERFKFSFCTTDLADILGDPGTGVVFIATRHDTHAHYAVQALQAGKHVFVEKPVVINPDQLRALADAWHTANQRTPTALMVGYNRRFAPMIVRLRDFFPTPEPSQIAYTVNAGPIPADSWHHAPEHGGGMLVGEMCHFIDLMIHLTRQVPVSVYASALSLASRQRSDRDNVTIVVHFQGGSVGTLTYNTVGSREAPKERLLVCAGGKTAWMEDYRSLSLHGEGRPMTIKSASQDKGQSSQIRRTLDELAQSRSVPIAFEEIVLGMEVVFAAQRSLDDGQVQRL